jgi:ribosomal protein S18 acetylase RimI-like enzyme
LRIRLAGAEDLEFLEAMLFEAFFWNPESPRPPLAGFRSDPEFQKLLANWGRTGDVAVIAESDGRQIGAAWSRLWTSELHSFGFVDAETPELALAVSKSHRRQGVGRRLLKMLIDHAREAGVPALSLSVAPANPSRFLYESLGFLRVGASGTSWTLRLSLR